MYSSLLLLFSLFSLALASAAGELSSDLAPRSGCAKGVHIIAIRGNGKNGGPFGIVKPLINSLLKGVPGSTAQPVAYPKDTTIRLANGPAVKAMTQEIESYAAKCPKTPIVLVGYSEGAGVTTNTLCGTDGKLFLPTSPLPTKYKKNIIAAIVYADGTRTPHQSYDKGSCKGSGTYPRENPKACAPWAPIIQSYCNKGDGFCCKGGSGQGAHYSYFRKYDKTVTEYVIKQFKKSQ